MDDDTIMNTALGVGVEGETVTLKFDGDDCAAQTLLMPPDEARYIASELLRAVAFIEKKAAHAESEVTVQAARVPD